MAHTPVGTYALFEPFFCIFILPYTTARDIVVQAVSDFNSIRTAIINQNINVPYATKTSEYDELIERIGSRFISGLQELTVRQIGVDVVFDFTECLFPNIFVSTIAGHDVLV